MRKTNNFGKEHERLEESTLELRVSAPPPPLMPNIYDAVYLI